VLGQAQTGTGKTAAFALPLLARLDLSQKSPQVLVLAPTRELAMQVAESFERYAVGMPSVSVTAIYGGQDYVPQLRALERGVHVVVGTPGRVMDHVRRGTLKLDGIRALVLDEADEMLRMGFAEDVDWILGQLPAERQIALFSATMPGPIRRIASEHLRDPIQITIDSGAKTADTVRQRYLVTVPHLKPMVLSRVLECEPTDGVIVFVKTKSTTENLADYLAAEGHRVAALSSDVAQAQRERIVEHLKNGNLDVIVATDVAARGLDVPRISHVINYDVPFDDESYVHRIGRTGRAGRSGEAIMFLLPRDRGILRRIERATRQTIEPMEIPSKRAINQCRVARFHERILEAMARPDLTPFASIFEQFRAKHEVAPEQLSAALVALAAGDRPLFVTDDIKGADFRLPPAMRDERGGRFGDRRGDHFGDRRGPDVRERGPRPRDAGRMETFRIDVGRNHQAMPGNIVGAITGELGVRSSIIGRIEIFDDHSTIDLLEGMPPEMFKALKQVMVAGQRLNIRRAGEAMGYEPRKERKPKTGKPRKPKRPATES
jgi:ATP-dependent RNA helicase DeaD